MTDTEILQESHYYPFGMAMNGAWQDIVNGPENNYLYNGKEMQSDFGLDWSDYGARYYDPAIGRWNGIDLLAEQYSSTSPYIYTLNNPIKFIDPDGMRVSLFDRLEEQGHKFGATSEEIQKRDELIDVLQSAIDQTTPKERFKQNAKEGHGVYETDNLLSISSDGSISEGGGGFSNEIKEFSKLIKEEPGLRLYTEIVLPITEEGGYFFKKSWDAAIEREVLGASSYPKPIQDAVTNFYKDQKFTGGYSNTLKRIDASQYSKVYNKIYKELLKNGVDLNNMNPRSSFLLDQNKKAAPGTRYKRNSFGRAFLFLKIEA
ncbi:MAG: RHS repeat domain-containing protein [Saprospiraceae bacterium]